MISLQTLGSVDLRKDDVELSTILAQPKRLALLAYLAAARPRGFHSRDTLLALFWPESDAERARNSLRQALHHLRRSLGEGAVPGRGDREIAVDTTLVQCDAVEFDEAIEAARWDDALRLYRGDFLPGLFVQDAPEAERWVEDERARRRRDAVDAAWKLADAAERAGDAGAAAKWGRQALALEPADEGALRRLLGLLDRTGDTAGAIAAFDDFARRLKKEYGLEPGRETTALIAAMRSRPAQAPGQAPSAGPAHLPRPLPEQVGSPAAPAAPVGTPPPVEPRRHRWLVPAAMAVALLTVAVAGIYTWRHRQAAGAPDHATVAVLPFVNMSGDAANEYLSDGLTEELLNLLAQVPELRVAARTSSFSFKNRNLPVDSIGRILRVRHLVEGSVRQSGAGPTSRVRITAQLVDAASGYHLWSGTFDARVQDVFTLQDTIGRVIVRTLRPRLATAAAPEPNPPRDPGARTAVVRGWQTFRRNNPEAYAAAVEHFQEAIRLDPEYGRAYAGLATMRMWQSSLRLIPPDSGYREAERLARRALVLDSTAHDAHLVLARLAERLQRNDSLADAHFARAIALAPSDPRAYGRQAMIRVRQGRKEEALALARRAVELDPNSPAVYDDLGHVYSALTMVREQEQALRTALKLDPGHPILLGNLGSAVMRQRRFDEAQKIVAEARRKAPRSPHLVGMDAYLNARLGRREPALALADTAAALGSSLVELASVYAMLDERDRAFALLDRAIRQRDDGLVSLFDTSVVHALRTDPRMEGIMQRVRAMHPR